jgi:hypothetical protein
MGFRTSTLWFPAIPLSCHPNYRALTFTLAGLSPAEHTSLSWLQRRVEDWRAGLGRSSCSLLTRPFVCECHSISTMLTFPIPATSNASHGFPAYTLTCLLHIKDYGTYPAEATFGGSLLTL